MAAINGLKKKVALTLLKAEHADEHIKQHQQQLLAAASSSAHDENRSLNNNQQSSSSSVPSLHSSAFTLPVVPYGNSVTSMLAPKGGLPPQTLSQLPQTSRGSRSSQKEVRGAKTLSMMVRAMASGRALHERPLVY